MSFLLDTSFLVRLANVDDPSYGQAFDALTELVRRKERMFVTPQVLIEFWSVSTRPVGAANGLGMSPSEADASIAAIVAEFPIASDRPEVWPALCTLLKSVEVLGKQIHDARLVAICHVHSIPRILTFNGRHFTRYGAIPPGLEVFEPAEVAASLP